MNRRDLRRSEAEWRATKQRPHRAPEPPPGILRRILQALGWRTKQ